MVLKLEKNICTLFVLENLSHNSVINIACESGIENLKTCLLDCVCSMLKRAHILNYCEIGVICFKSNMCFLKTLSTAVGLFKYRNLQDTLVSSLVNYMKFLL